MDLLAVVAIVLALGVASRVIADRLRIPSVLFFITAGLLIGPEALDLVSRETFGNGLTALVGASVAIILFEGAYHLQISKIREAPTATIRLVTIGAALTWLGTAVAVAVLFGTSWPVALLVGSLLIATGPTVIAPILNVVTVRDHVSAILESEGIFNDVSAAILAVVIFEVLVTESGPLSGIVLAFGYRLAIGVITGLIIAGIVWILLSHVGPSIGNRPLHARLIVLAAVIATFASAETIASETGIAAAATLGFVLGNVDVPHRDEVITFLDDLSVIVLAFVFVALATLIEFDDILALGVGGVLVVVAVTVIIRPLVIFISVTEERFTLNEKLFLSAVGPRGIIPASVATLFAIELQTVGQSQAAQTLAGTVFLIIFVTVVLQAGLARQIAKQLGVIPMRTIIVGGGRVGRALAERLEQDGENVVLVEESPDAATDARKAGFRVVEGDGSDPSVLRKAGIEDAKFVVAATPDDDVNLLVCQVAKTRFDVGRIVSRVHDPGNVDAFETLGIGAISESLATAWSLENVLERPALSKWMNEVGRGGDVQEIEVTAEDLADRSIASVNANIPDGCIVGVVTRGDESQVPDGDFVLEYGDHVTFIGQMDAVDRAVKRFHPHD